MMNRRNFIQLTGASLASLLVADFLKAEGIKSTVIQMPDEVKIFYNDMYFPLQSSDKQTWYFRDVAVKLKNTKYSVPVFIHSPSIELKEVQLSWKF